MLRHTTFMIKGGFGIGISTFLAFRYLFILRIPGLLVVVTWSCILLVLVILIVAASLLLKLASTWQSQGRLENQLV